MADVSIDKLTQGIDFSGAKEYVDKVKAIAIDDTKDLLGKKEGVEDALRIGWVGQAESNFEKNFETAIDAVKNQLDQAYEAFLGEIMAIQSAWQTQDEGMVQVVGD